MTTRPAGAGVAGGAPPRGTARFLRASGGSARLACRARIAVAVTRHSREAPCRKPLGDAPPAPLGTRLHEWTSSDRLASSSVALVNETLYLALFSRLHITTVVPLG